jgi:hypothetical protein
MSKLTHLESEVLQLPEDQRFLLLNRILSGSEPSCDSDVEAAWASEITRRIKLVDDDKTERIPASEVFRDLDQRFA